MRSATVRCRQRCRRQQCSFQFGAGLVTARAALGGHQFALLYVEACFGINFPFMEAGAAQRDAFGAFLQTRLADGAEVDDVGAIHWLYFLSKQIGFRNYCDADPFGFCAAHQRLLFALYVAWLNSFLFHIAP